VALNGYQAMKVREFGGLATWTDPTNLPHFMSPDCSDIEFLPGLWRTRPGLTTELTSANPDKINYLKSFILRDGTVRTLWLDSDGNLFYENVTTAPGVAVPITDATMIPGDFGNSVTLFGREYIAFPQGQFGSDIPRAYDGTNTDRVSQVGPGAAPTATDEVSVLSTLGAPNGLGFLAQGVIVASPNGLTQTGNVVTVSITGGGGATVPLVLQPGDSVTIAGAGVGGYNGTFAVAKRISATKFQVYNNTLGLANSGGGTVTWPIYVATLTAPGPWPSTFTMTSRFSMTIAGAGVAGYNGTWQIRMVGNTAIYFIGPALGLGLSGGATVTLIGNIQAGVHQVTVMFLTRNGYITAPAPPLSWTAIGGKRVQLTNIPIGPPNVVARIVAFTPFSSDSFFYIPDSTNFASIMIINDNTTTSQVFDFTDVDLLNGTNVDNLFELITLGPAAGVTSYNNRLVWWGELNKVDDFVNLSFDGGFTTNPVGTYPLGWTPDATSFTGGGFSGFGQVFGNAYAISGDGVTATRGLITQPAFQDAFGAQILQLNTNYSVRVRLASVGIGPFTQGTLHLEFFSSGTLAGSFSIQCKTLTSQFLSYSGSVLSSLANIPTDLTLRIYVDGTPDNLATVAIDEIEFFPTSQPFLNTQVRFSKVEDPDSYDGLTSILQPAEESGQSVNCCFVLRDYLYLVKDRSLFVTQDTGQTEPDEWEVDEISSKVGTPSARGVGLGDEWAVIASESGLWLFSGGILTDDRNLAKEIQPTWDSINWQYGFLIDVKVDTARKRIYVACPLGTATQNNTILTLDYTQGFQSAIENDGAGRKWSPWKIGSNSQNIVLRQNGILQFYIGSNATSGKIYLLDETARSDDGVAIDGYWQSGYFQDSERLNYGYITANVIGSGVCQITLRKGDQGWSSAIRGWFLNTLGFKNVERQIQKQGYRMAVRFETNAVGSWMSMQGMAMYVAPAVWSPVQGVNA